MGRDKIYKSIVEKCLKNNSLTYKKLKSTVMEELKGKTIQDKNLKEVLMILLEEGQISIVGYNLEDNDKGRRLQSIPVSGLIFEGIKRDQWDIYKLLTQMENWASDTQKSNKDKNTPKIELKSIFKKKYKEYEKKEKLFYKSMLKKVKELPAIEEYKAEIQYFNEIKAQYEEAGIDWKADKSTVNFRRSYIKMEFFFNSGNLSKMSKVMIVEDLTQEDIRKITIQKQKRVIKDVDEKTLSHFMDNLITTKMRWLDIEGQSTKESYLKMWNFHQQRSNDEMNTLFNNILFFININENYKFLKQSLSLALSDEKESWDWFESFINFVPTIRLYPKLQENLGFKEVKPYI
jgi:hypothetical protein